MHQMFAIGNGWKEPFQSIHFELFFWCGPRYKKYRSTAVKNLEKSHTKTQADISYLRHLALDALEMCFLRRPSANVHAMPCWEMVCQPTRNWDHWQPSGIQIFVWMFSQQKWCGWKSTKRLRWLCTWLLDFWMVAGYLLTINNWGYISKVYWGEISHSENQGKAPPTVVGRWCH